MGQAFWHKIYIHREKVIELVCNTSYKKLKQNMCNGIWIEFY